MKRIKETFILNLEPIGVLTNKVVLEVGCGNGAHSVGIAACCAAFIGIDPNPVLVNLAISRNIPNARFSQEKAEALSFAARSFDVVIFTLSFHHIPQEHMAGAIDEAIRVVKKDGYIVFLEPGTEGSFFDAEIQFDACDGDERVAKENALTAMMEHHGLVLVREIPDETVFQFESCDDFVTTMNPHQGLGLIEEFLIENNYTLNAERRISVFRPS
jgi:ubiquinone/menaquinone biosynthesis C-methylase UbiE